MIFASPGASFESVVGRRRLFIGEQQQPLLIFLYGDADLPLLEDEAVAFIGSLQALAGKGLRHRDEDVCVHQDERDGVQID